MVVVSEEIIEEHLRIVEICENGRSIIIGDLPLIQINVRGEDVASMEVGKGVRVRFVNVSTDLGAAEIEIYHVMGTDTAVSFMMRLEGCGHSLANIYAEVIKALRSGGRSE